MTIPRLVQAPLNAPAALGSHRSLPKPAGPSATPRYGMTMWFQVVVATPTGPDNLGLWSGCSGLAVALETKELRSGGEYEAPYLYPEQITYPNVKLERAMERGSSAQVRAWLEAVTRDWIGGPEGGAALAGDGSGFRGTTVTITLLTALAPGTRPDQRQVATWELQDAIPVHWQGPTLTAKNGDIAVEQLTLAHRGFLKRNQAGAGDPTQFTNQGQGKLRLSDAKKPGDVLVFQYSPATLTEQLTVLGAEDNRTLEQNRTKEEGLVYNRKNIVLSELHIEGVKAVKDAYDKLWRWTESSIGGNQASDSEPGKSKPTAPELHLRLGSGTAGVVINEKITITRVSFHYQRFTPAGVPSRAKLTLTVTVRPRAAGATAPGEG